jgi:hypothetical protein
MTLVLDPRGTVDSLKFSDKLAGAVAKLPPEVASFTATMSEDSLRRMLGQCLPALPKDAPAKDKPWDSKLEAKYAGIGKVALDNKHASEGTVTRAGRRVEKITTKAKLSFDADAGSGTTYKVVEQDLAGTSYFDRATGRLIETVFASKLTIEATRDEQKVTIKVKTETTLKPADKEK